MRIHGVTMTTEEKSLSMLESLPELEAGVVEKLYDVYAELTGPAIETTWSNPNKNNPDLPRLSDERIEELTDWDHLQDCSHGRLREIIFELQKECVLRGKT